MRNIYEAVRRRDHDEVKRHVQQIYQAASLTEARQAFRRFKWNWRTA
jgi:transposase-like protein